MNVSLRLPDNMFVILIKSEHILSAEEKLYGGPRLTTSNQSKNFSQCINTLIPLNTPTVILFKNVGIS